MPPFNSEHDRFERAKRHAAGDHSLCLRAYCVPRDGYEKKAAEQAMARLLVEEFGFSPDDPQIAEDLALDLPDWCSEEYTDEKGDVQPPLNQPDDVMRLQARAAMKLGRLTA
jgi:hypothetical protein